MNKDLETAGFVILWFLGTLFIVYSWIINPILILIGVKS